VIDAAPSARPISDPRPRVRTGCRLDKSPSTASHPRSRTPTATHNGAPLQEVVVYRSYPSHSIRLSALCRGYPRAALASIAGDPEVIGSQKHWPGSAQLLGTGAWPRVASPALTVVVSAAGVGLPRPTRQRRSRSGGPRERGARLVHTQQLRVRRCVSRTNRPSAHRSAGTAHPRRS
jgi:hypothetical protein